MTTKNHRGKKVEFDKIMFDSSMEMKYYRDVLKPQLEAGEITELTIHSPKIELLTKFKDNEGVSVRAVVYEPDFCYMKDGKYFIEDTKGLPTADAKLKLKLLKYLYKDSTDTVIRWIGYCKDLGFDDFDKVQSYMKRKRKDRMVAKGECSK